MTGSGVLATSSASRAGLRRAVPGHEGARLALWGLVSLVVALVHDRLWATPNLSYFSAIAARLGERPFGDDPGADYLLTNLGLPSLARLLGQTDPHEYARLHLFVLVVGLAVCVALAHRRYGYRTARTLVVLLAAAPGVTVSLQWLGQPDALTFPLGVALALVGRRASLVVLAVLLGLTHPEQAVFIVVAAAVVRAVLDEDSAVRVAARRAVLDLVAMAAGVAAGRLVTEVYLRANDITILRPRSQLLRQGLDEFVEHHLQEPAPLVYLLWGPLWLVVVAVPVVLVLQRGRGVPARRWGVLGALALGLLVPVAVTLDETRVYAMLTAPVLAGAAVLLARHPGTRVLSSGRAAAVLLAVVLVVPGGFTAGTSTWSWELPIGEIVPFLVDGDHPGRSGSAGPDGWLMTPFDFVIPLPAQG